MTNTPTPRVNRQPFDTPANPCAVLQVSFHGCEAGWINLDIRMGDHHATFQCSDLYDPAPDLLAWLEGISLGLTRVAWTLDQEGSSVTFDASTKQPTDWGALPREPILLDVRPSDGEALPAIELARSTLIDAFYDAFRSFATSVEYDPKQWECLGNAALVEERSGTPAQEWLESLCKTAVPRRNVQDALWRVERVLCTASWDDLMQAGEPDDHLRLTGEPCPSGYRPLFWRLTEWDDLDEAGRRQWLNDWLEDPLHPWHGTPWPAMRSPWIEHWQRHRGELGSQLKWLPPQWPQRPWSAAGPSREAQAICGAASRGAAP